jgi:hypothetical protein
MISISVENLRMVNAMPRAPANLFHQVGNKRQDSQVAGAFHSGGYAALVFEAITGDAAGQQFALLIDELEQEFGIFVIDVFDTEFAETAVFFVFQPDFRVAKKLYIFS